MPSTRWVFGLCDWLAPPIKEGQADFRNFLAARKPYKPSGGLLLRSTSLVGEPNIVGDLGLAHQFLQPHWGPLTSARPFIRFYINCCRFCTPFHGCHSCSPLLHLYHLPLIQASPFLPELELPDFHPQVHLPTAPEWSLYKPGTSCRQLVPHLPFNGI